MQPSRDSSVWRTLAVAFGDGLAFGVGVTLTRSAARMAAARAAAPEVRPVPNGWHKAIEQRSEPETLQPAAENVPVPDQPADPLLTAIEGNFKQTVGQIDLRLSQLASKIEVELEALDAQDHELAEGVEARIDGLRAEVAASVAAHRQGIDADMRALRTQMTAIHKDFAETLARLVDEQIGRTVDARLQAVEEKLHEAIRHDTAREEARTGEQARQIAELREILENQEQNVRNLVFALGQSCLKAVGETPAAEPAAPAPPPAANSAPLADADLPGFARPRSRKPLWRVPIVPSFLAATGSLLLLHYL